MDGDNEFFCGKKDESEAATFTYIVGLQREPGLSGTVPANTRKKIAKARIFPDLGDGLFEVGLSSWIFFEHRFFARYKCGCILESQWFTHRKALPVPLRVP